jgi:hypothetical protein
MLPAVSTATPWKRLSRLLLVNGSTVGVLDPALLRPDVLQRLLISEIGRLSEVPSIIPRTKRWARLERRSYVN